MLGETKCQSHKTWVSVTSVQADFDTSFPFSSILQGYNGTVFAYGQVIHFIS